MAGLLWWPFTCNWKSYYLLLFAVVISSQNLTVSGNSNVTEGDNTTLTCTPASSLSNATYEWYLGGRLLTNASSRTYTIRAVKMSDNGNSYSCKVKHNGVTSGMSYRFILRGKNSKGIFPSKSNLFKFS